MKKIKKEGLSLLFKELKKIYKVIGPKIENGSIVLTEIEYEDIPFGYKDHQGKGFFRLEKVSSDLMFSFSNGIDSLKRFLFPPYLPLFVFKRSKKGIQIETVKNSDKPLAFFGVRACDLTALRLYDRIFLEGLTKDYSYHNRRSNSFIVALNCTFTGDNCFCSSMGSGPEVKTNFDIALTEIEDLFFLEAGTQKGKAIINVLPVCDADENDFSKKSMLIESCKKEMKKHIDSYDLPSLIYRNFEHPRWQETSKRDLECGNCTQVCPTCFCNSTFDKISISEIKKYPYVSGVRMRAWDSCFSRNFARVHGGNFRYSRKARYRHWVSHKMAYMKEQFGITGCVGCGRCITWCPAGIDITEEINAIKR
jgi:ferredoxin